MDSKATDERSARLRRAAMLNFLLPGAGQFTLGQRGLGILMMAAFCCAFVVALGIFLAGMNAYFSVATNGNILEGDTLESLGGVFHVPWLMAAALVAVLDFVASIALLWLKPPAP